MARYNHFSTQKYKELNFHSLAIMDSFRMDKRDGNRRRKDILMIKTGPLTYREVKSKKEYTLLNTDIIVHSHYQLTTNG